MSIAFSNQWFRDFCKNENLDPDCYVAQIWVKEARQEAVKIYKRQQMISDYEAIEDDGGLIERLEEDIQQLDEKRVEHMLFAVTMAEINKENGGDAFDKQMKKRLVRQEASEKNRPLKASTDTENRILDRWDNVGTKDSWEQIKQQFNDRNGGD